MRKEGSESEPASSTHIKGCLVCTTLSCGITLQQKNISPPAQPNFTLARLQSLAITLIRCQLCIVSLAALTHAKKRNVPLMIRGFATPPHLAHAHTQRKETYFAPPIAKHCANGSPSPHQEGGAIDNQMRLCHHCSNSKTYIHICCW